MEMEQDQRARGRELDEERVRAAGAAVWVATSQEAVPAAIASVRAAAQLPLIHGAYRAPPRSAPSAEPG